MRGKIKAIGKLRCRIEPQCQEDEPSRLADLNAWYDQVCSQEATNNRLPHYAALVIRRAKEPKAVALEWAVVDCPSDLSNVGFGSFLSESQVTNFVKIFMRAFKKYWYSVEYEDKVLLPDVNRDYWRENILQHHEREVESFLKKLIADKDKSTTKTVWYFDLQAFAITVIDPTDMDIWNLRLMTPMEDIIVIFAQPPKIGKKWKKSRMDALSNCAWLRYAAGKPPVLESGEEDGTSSIPQEFESLSMSDRAALLVKTRLVAEHLAIVNVVDRLVGAEVDANTRDKPRRMNNCSKEPVPRREKFVRFGAGWIHHKIYWAPFWKDNVLEQMQKITDEVVKEMRDG